MDFHSRNQVCKNVRDWLNGEWNKKHKTSINMFTALTMKSVSPTGKHVTSFQHFIDVQNIILTSFLHVVATVPKQCNTVDCGVYICKYALTVFQLCFLPITYKQLHVCKPALPTMSASLPFQFNGEDIVQLRVKMKQLPLKLSNVYVSWKTNELVSNIACSPKPTTEHDCWIHPSTQYPLSANDMETPAKDSVESTTGMKASEGDKQPSKQHIEVLPNKWR
jgi:hypothetical protein